MFLEHRIPEVLHSDNGPQYASAQFTEFCTSWGITHETSNPHYLQSNRFAEVCVKSMKHALQCTKYSGADPQLAMLALQATPINAKLPSPAELLYWCQIRTTIPARIQDTNPVALQICEWIDTHFDASKLQADNNTNPLHPCMLASLLQCTTPSTRSRSLPLWYMSCQKTATKCTPVMAWSTAAQDDTFMNAVSSPLTLPLMSHQPHCRLLTHLAFLCECLHPPSLHICHSLCLLHRQCLWLQNHRHQLAPRLPLCLHLHLQHPV